LQLPASVQVVASRSAQIRNPKKKKGASKDAPFLSGQRSPNQVQVITPLVMSQTLAVCVWVAVALHEGGGPATPVTTTVTFCEGLKPWRGAAAVAVPEK
jgi:hypothetical protein